jgi:hypothetical protein
VVDEVIEYTHTHECPTVESEACQPGRPLKGSVTCLGISLAYLL